MEGVLMESGVFSPSRALIRFEEWLASPPPSFGRASRVVSLALPFLLVGYGVLYERNSGVTPAADAMWLRIVAYALAGAGLYLNRRAPWGMVLLAVLCWWATGSALFVIAASFLLAWRQPRFWWAYVIVFAVVHPLGLVPEPQVFAAGHALLPIEAVPVYACLVPALLGFVLAMSARAVELRRASLEAEVVAASAQARSVVALDRLNISQEMHDILGQRLSLMVLHATAAVTQDPEPEVRRLLERIAREGNETLVDLHYIIKMLRQPDIEDVHTPAPSLSDSIDRARLEGLHVHAVVNDAQLVSLPVSVSSLIRAVAREALHNAVKHAPGTSVMVAFEEEEEEEENVVRFRVENDLAPSRTAASITPGGFGLAALARQAADLGGTLVAHSTGSGVFAVVLTVPR